MNVEGTMRKLSLERARRIWPILVRRAKSRSDPRITYGALGEPLGIHPRVMSWPLGIIQEYLDARGEPALQSLVVSKRSMVPGNGYWATSTEDKAIQKEIERVRKHKWPKTAPF